MHNFMGGVRTGIIPPDYGPGARIMVYLMLAVIGYAAYRPLGKGISNLLKKWIIGNPQT